MGTAAVVGIVLAVVAAAVGAVLIVRRRRYLAALEARGWAREPRPSLGVVLDLQAPPFGMGYSREVRDLVWGTTPTGLAFRAFKYTYGGAGRGFSGRLVTLGLPFALPVTFAATGGHRPGVAGYEVPARAGSVVSESNEFALAARDALDGLPAAEEKVDLSIDGNHLVVAGAPKQPDELELFLAGLDPVVRALSGLSGFARPAPEPRLGFFGRPDWQLIGEDDGLLGLYPHTRAGYDHHTTDAVRGLRDGIRLDAFTHAWKQDHVESYTDANGNQQTRIVTEDFDEAICGFLLPFALPRLSVSGGVRFGERVRFESIAFNDSYRVSADDPKFAMDCIHPRMMEWLLATGAAGFSIDGDLVQFPVEVHDLLLVGACEDTLHGFLQRIPRFVWQDLGFAPPANLIG